MIREATARDIPAIVGMTERLRASVGSPLEVDRAATSSFVSGLLCSPLGWVRVVDSGNGPSGFLAASVGTASISMLPIGVEHGWWAEQGGGLRLLREYIAWGRQAGCFAVRMSTPPHDQRAGEILERCGFAIAEVAWVKVL